MKCDCWKCRFDRVAIFFALGLTGVLLYAIGMIAGWWP